MAWVHQAGDECDYKLKQRRTRTADGGLSEDIPNLPSVDDIR